MPEERPPSEFEIEQQSEQELIRRIKEKGPEDPETRDTLITWTREQEERVRESNDPEAAIQFNLKRGRLYSSAGYPEEALKNFESARMQAWNESMDALHKAIMTEMDQLEL